MRQRASTKLSYLVFRLLIPILMKFWAFTINTLILEDIEKVDKANISAAIDQAYSRVCEELELTRLSNSPE